MRRHKSEGAARRRTDLAFAAIAALCLAGFAFLVITMQGLSHDLRTANEARDALATQVQELGGTPVAGEPGSRGEVGPAGPSGPAGKRGDPGKPAPTITPSPGPSGPPGEDGSDGADSTVPGPTGPSGRPGEDATGAPGRDGRDGVDGQDGSDGRDGSDGKPPAGWTWTHGGVTYTCRPANEFDPDNPHYECEPSGPNPEPSEPKGPLNLAMDPSRRRW